MTVHRLDTIGLKCPLPIIKMARLAQTLTAGDQIEITSSDPAAEFDVVAWARMKDHQCSAPVIADEPWSVTFVVTVGSI